MKKAFFIIFIMSSQVYSQSITIDPSNAGWFDHLVKIRHSFGGFEHRSDNGLVGIGTWVNQNYAYLRTISDHNLSFATNNSGPQMTLTTTGRVGIGFNLLPDAQLDVERGTGSSGTAAFRGTNWDSHINYSTPEDTYIRGGKDGSKVIINDVATLGGVGIGTANPTKAFLVVDKKIGATHAIFGENVAGVAIESDFPGISFNGYWNSGRKPLVNGFVGGIGMNPSTGLITIYNTYSSGTAGNIVTTQDVIAMNFDGKVGIGNSNPQAKLHVTGGLVRIDALSGGTGLRNVLVDSQGTLTNDSPVAFSAFNVNNYPSTIVSNVETTFPFTNEDYDLGSFYNNSLYEFLAPTNGIYHFDLFVTFGAVASPSLNTLFSIRFYVDGGLNSVINEPIISGNLKTLNLSQDLKLNAGQKIQARVIQTSGGTVQLIGGTSSRFTGRLITRL